MNMVGSVKTRYANGQPGPTYDASLMQQSFAKNAAIKDQFGDYGSWESSGKPSLDWQKYTGPSASYGGVSGVNPQAGQANELDAFKRYEDAAFSNAMGRLNPQFQQQGETFEQRMSNQGIPVGSEAYNKARTQMDLSQNDARSNAAFNAMGFGANLQNQSFQQDNARSQLANALMQAQMQKDVGMANVGLGYKGLAQDNSQFGRTLEQNANQFNAGLGQRAYEFDSGQNYDYWNSGNQFGLQNRALDSSDYFNTWDRNTNESQWNDSLIMQLLTGGAPNPYAIDPTGAYATQIGGANTAYGNMMGMFGGLGSGFLQRDA